MPEVLPSLRRDIIAARLESGCPVVASTLAAEFQVSEDAIRRDLRFLASAGRCRRIYGGALPLSPASSPMAVRRLERLEGKRALARSAVRLVQDGEVLFLDNGSTNLAMVAELRADQSLTVVTNSIPIAAAVLDACCAELIVVGGAVDREVGGCVDAHAVLEAQRLNVDRCFLGACSVSIEEGVSAFDHADAVFKRMLVGISRRVELLATSEKLETRAPHRVATLDQIDHLFVESDVPPSLLEGLAAAGVVVVQAELTP